LPAPQATLGRPRRQHPIPFETGPHRLSAATPSSPDLPAPDVATGTPWPSELLSTWKLVILRREHCRFWGFLPLRRPRDFGAPPTLAYFFARLPATRLRALSSPSGRTLKSSSRRTSSSSFRSVDGNRSAPDRCQTRGLAAAPSEPCGRVVTAKTPDVTAERRSLLGLVGPMQRCLQPGSALPGS
jgi:hypothetical protein